MTSLFLPTLTVSRYQNCGCARWRQPLPTKLNLSSDTEATYLKRVSSTPTYVTKLCSLPCNTLEWRWQGHHTWVSDATWHTGEATFSTVEDLARIIISCQVTTTCSSTAMPLPITAVSCTPMTLLRGQWPRKT